MKADSSKNNWGLTLIISSLPRRAINWGLSLIVLGPVISLAPPDAHAGALDALQAFVKGTQSGRAEFSQVVIGRTGKTSNTAKGVFEFSRPGRFRWVYLQPYEQTIVGDGDRLWIYDKDLNQVTVRKLGNALGQTPAAILSGTNDLEKSFSLKDGGARDGIEWVEATPKARDTQFEKVRIGFSPQGMLSSMELTDAFGQVSRLSFGALERGVRFPAEHFRFTPPTGADVMSDSK